MNAKQQVFVSEYLKCWNASEAARRAGYNGRSNTIGSRLLLDVDIAAEIERRVAELKLSADECVLRLADQARGSLEDFLEFEEIVFDPPRIDEAGHPHEREIVCTGINLAKAKAAGKLHLLKSVTNTGKGGLKVELYDAQHALELLGKAHGLFIDKTEITGKDGSPIVITTVEAVKPDGSA
jgi:phage terminase small subunit